MNVEMFLGYLGERRTGIGNIYMQVNMHVVLRFLFVLTSNYIIFHIYHKWCIHEEETLLSQYNIFTTDGS